MVNKLITIPLVICLCISGRLAQASAKSAQLKEKIDQLEDLNARRPVIRLDNEKFKNLVKSTPRNYSMIVMFTALKPQRNCQVCKQAHDEFQIVANSYWYGGQRTSQLYLAMVDFDEGNDAFTSMKLNTAPVFIHFPSKGKPKKQDTMEIHRYGFDAEVIAKFVAERTSVQIKVVRPPNYMMNILILLSVGLVSGLAYIKRDSLDFMFQRTTWACIVISFILVMMSGQMWNQIRGAAFAHKDRNTGAVSYIHGSSQGQFVAETYIVMMLHGAIALGVVLLNESVTQKNMEPAVRKVMSAAGLICLALFFSIILSIFRGKYQGYPYRFLL